MTKPIASDRTTTERMEGHPIQLVVAFDFSPISEEALRQAIVHARTAPPPEHVLHVVTAIDPREGLAISPTRHVTLDYADRIQRLVAARVADMIVGAPHAAAIRHFIHARIGQAADEILGVVHSVDAARVFIGSHGKTLSERLVLGSVSERVIREARCTVVVARTRA
jgi:nucleotide-binding universal stress UspA family protein